MSESVAIEPYYPLEPSPEAYYNSSAYALQLTQKKVNEAGKAIIAAGSFFPKTKRARTAQLVKEEPKYNIKTYEEMYTKIDLLHEIVNKIAEFLFYSGMGIKPPSHLREMQDFDVTKVVGLQENIEFIRRWARYIGFTTQGIEAFKCALWAGNAYLEIVYDSNNIWRVPYLKLINPAEMRVIRSETGDILGYLQFPYNSGILSSISRRRADYLKSRYPNHTVEFDPEEILHIKWDALPGEPYGISIFESLKDIMAIIIGMREDMGVIIRNHAAPTILFRLGTDLIPASKVAIDDFANYLLNSFDNSTNLVASTLVQGEVLDTSSKIIDLPKYIKAAINILYAGAGIPEILLGQGNETTEATAKQQLESVEKKFKAMQQLFKDAIELQIFARLCKQVAIVADKVILQPKDMDIIPELYFPPIESIEERRLRLEGGVQQGSLPHEVYRKEYGYSPKLEGTYVIAEDREFQKELTKLGKVQLTGTGTKQDGKKAKKPSDRDDKRS